MCSLQNLYIAFAPALLLSLSLCLSACSGRTDEPTPEAEQFVDADEMVVLVTDSTEWRVKVFKEHLLYSEAVAVKLPAPWCVPTKEQAQVLRTLSFPNDERFITSDGYTFGMPSSSVSKAGTKTQYSVLGLYVRRTVIVVTF